MLTLEIALFVLGSLNIISKMVVSKGKEEENVRTREENMRKNFLSVLVMCVLVLVLTACGDDGSKGIFYEVEGGENQVYLFGSVHMGNQAMYPLDSNVEDAFDQSDVLAMELDMVNVSEFELASKINELAVFNDGRSMTDIVPKDTFLRLHEVVAPFGITQEVLNQFQPWYGTMLLSEVIAQQSNVSVEYGVETYFMEQAEDMEVIGLETVESQLSPFNLLSDESQAIYLEKSLDELDESEDELDELIRYWKEGDVEAFAQIRHEMMSDYFTDSHKEYQTAFLDGRDEKMAGEIADLLESESGNTYFVVVGSLHLAGENSIVEQLIEKGYTVEIAN
ncbi:TraB/GumN family protein [Proteinivorax tanatarense]|uniref:TraB/GumN family protein n=1 Tax=Proteinivorax tanatarense TaxID=1260629 RepID=A0AAU7VKR1_9FIRM